MRLVPHACYRGGVVQHGGTKGNPALRERREEALSGRRLSEWVSTIIIVCAALMLVGMLAFGVPVFGSPSPAADKGQYQSLENRNESSLQGNFGQCRSDNLGGVGAATSEYNPNPNNPGEAACRTAGNEQSESICVSAPAGQCPRLGPGKGSQ